MKVKAMPYSGTLEVVVIDNAEDFTALQPEWEDLYHNSSLATPFQSWAWLRPWWEFYGEGYQLRLITIRDGSLLVGVVPLMLERRARFGRLLFLGTGLTDHLDVLIREGWEEGVSEAALRAIGEMKAWRVADLQQLRPEAAAWGLFRRWNRPRARAWQDGFPVVDTKSWDELLMSVDRKLRSNARRTLRRAKEDNVVCRLAEPADAERAARRLVALHREMWQGRDIGLEHLTGRFEAHVVAAAVRLTACGLGGIYEFWRDGEVIAAHFLLFGHSFVGEYMFGVTQEARRRFQVSSLNLWNLVNVAHTRGSTRVSQLRGEEAYKLQWASEVIPNHRLILSRGWIAWAPYAGYHLMRSRARRYVNTESAPQWAKHAAGKYRALRRGATRQARKSGRP
jgi:CelD/BcsL family acetyltransferase involved in cellulose biosynthesis